jgi:hypothetical protein
LDSTSLVVVAVAAVADEGDGADDADDGDDGDVGVGVGDDDDVGDDILLFVINFSSSLSSAESVIVGSVLIIGDDCGER